MATCSWPGRQRCIWLGNTTSTHRGAKLTWPILFRSLSPVGSVLINARIHSLPEIERRWLPEILRLDAEDKWMDIGIPTKSISLISIGTGYPPAFWEAATLCYRDTDSRKVFSYHRISYRIPGSLPDLLNLAISRAPYNPSWYRSTCSKSKHNRVLPRLPFICRTTNSLTT